MNCLCEGYNTAIYIYVDLVFDISGSIFNAWHYINMSLLFRF